MAIGEPYNERMVVAVQGEMYWNWKSARVTLTVDSAYQEFQFSTAEPIDVWGDSDQWHIKPGDPCVIFVGGVEVLRGYVEIRETFYDANQHAVMFYGRDYNATAFVSSVKMNEPSVNFHNATFSQIMARALQGYATKIVVRDAVIDSYIFPDWAIGFGETPWNVAERLKKYIPAMRVTSDPIGTTWIAHTISLEASGETFIEGVNILSARAIIDAREAIQLVHVKMQAAARDTQSAGDAADIEADATDTTLPDERYHAIPGQDPGTKQLAQGAADHDIMQRGQDAVHCTIKVHSWFEKEDGPIYRILVPYTVNSPMLQMDNNPLWSRMVQYEQSDAGSTTTIELSSVNVLFPWWKQGNPVKVGDSNFAGQAVQQAVADARKRARESAPVKK